jgi:hypothetical protein
VSELKRSRLGWNPRVELVGVEWSPYHTFINSEQRLPTIMTLLVRYAKIDCGD